MATLASLLIDLGANVARLQQDMDRASRVVSSWESRTQRTLAGVKTAFAGLGVAIGTGAFVAGVKNAINAMDDLGKMSQRVGVSVESLSALKFAGDLADVSMEQLSTGLRQLSKNMADMQAGTGDAQQAFMALKINVEGSKGSLKTTEQVLFEIADKFAKMEDGAGKTAIAMRIFGKSGDELIPLLNQGAKGLRENAEEARKFGLIISTEAAKRAEEFNDNLARIGTTSKALGFALAEELLPPLSRVAEKMAEAIREGEGFGGVLRSLLQLSPMATDLAKYNREFVQLSDELFSAQNERLRRQALGQTEEVAALDEHIKKLQERLKIVGDMRKVLGGEMTVTGQAVAPKKEGKKGAAPKLVDPAAVAKEAAEAQRFMQQWFRSIDTTQEEAIRQGQELIQSEVSITAQIVETGQRNMQAIFDMIDREQAEAIEQGAILTQDITENHKKLDEQLNRNKDTARELGLTFVSAFEDAIVEGKKFGDVLKSLAIDIARLAVRKTVTEPLLGGLGKVFEGLFGGSSGHVDTIAGAISGSGVVGSFASGTDYVPRTGLALVHQGERIIPANENGGGVTINQTIQFAANTPAAVRDAVMAMLPTIQQATLGAVADATMRGGSFSRALRGA